MKYYILFLTALTMKMYKCMPTELLYVLPDNPTNVSCPSEPCATLSQYLMNNISGMSNVKFLILSGEHNFDSDIIMQDVSNVTMVGISYSAPAILFCHLSEAVIVFANASNIMIANLMFNNCGNILFEQDTWVIKPATVFLSICYYCNVTNVTFIGFGITINHLLGNSNLDNVTLYLQATKHGIFDRHSRVAIQGIELTNHGPLSCFISHNIINVRKITIVASSNKIRTIHPDDMGMCILFNNTDYNTTLLLSESNFLNVNIQPILKINLFNNAVSRIMLWIKNCKFQYNGNQELQIQKPAVDVVLSYIQVAIYFMNCLFSFNSNKSPLISLQIEEIYHSFRSVDSCSFPTYIQIKHSNFLHNSGPLVNITGDKKSQCFAHFSLIGPFKIVGNDGMKNNIIRTNNVLVNIIGKGIFSDNCCARNVILFYSCTVIFHKNISFIGNGLSGLLPAMDSLTSVDHIITLQSNLAYINVMENTNIEFINNSYHYQAIQLQLENNTPYPFCIFQYGTVTLKNMLDTLNLLKNYSVIFHSGSLSTRHDNESVKFLIDDYAFHCKWLPKAVFHGYHPADINKQIIQTDDEQMYQHTSVCYCFMNNTFDCSLDLLGPVFPGQVLQVDLRVPHGYDSNKTFILFVEIFNTLLPSLACKVARPNEMLNTISSSSKTCNFTIISESENECDLFLTAEPNLHKRYDVFYVQLLPCPFEFTL